VSNKPLKGQRAEPEAAPARFVTHMTLRCNPLEQLD
jgi:hypothetical protein